MYRLRDVPDRQALTGGVADDPADHRTTRGTFQRIKTDNRGAHAGANGGADGRTGSRTRGVAIIVVTIAVAAVIGRAGTERHAGGEHNSDHSCLTHDPNSLGEKTGRRIMLATKDRKSTRLNSSH